MTFYLKQRMAGEAVGTAFLLMAVVGSGIMGARLAGGIEALALIANTAATGAALIVLILWFGPVSGAHLNPAVTLAFWLERRIGGRDSLCYVAAQMAGGLAGVILANVMFAEPAAALSATGRTGPGQWLSEAIATFGLVAVILGLVRTRPAAVAYAVGLYISAAYWFTASTAFANPAVTIGRIFTQTFSGIYPGHAAPFVLCQLIGAGAAAAFSVWLFGRAGAADPVEPSMSAEAAE